MTDEIYLKNSLTVNNSIITLGDTDDSGKGRHFKSRFIQPGLAGYPGQYGNALIKKENLDKFVYTLRNKPVIINHKDEIEEKDKVGEVFNVWFNPDDGWYWCDGIITDVTAQNLIKDKGWSVSCSYNFTSYNDDGGTENNVPYDIEFLDGEFMHLAIVDKPRYEGANIVMNAKDKDNEGEWITVKGNHILVKEGQTKEEAVQSFIEKQQSKSSDKKEEEPKTKEEKIKYINDKAGSNIDLSDSYSSKDIDKLYKHLKEGGEIHKINYEWVPKHSETKETELKKGDSVYLTSQDGPNKRVGKITKQISGDVVEVEFEAKGGSPARTDRYYINELTKESETKDKSGDGGEAYKNPKTHDDLKPGERYNIKGSGVWEITRKEGYKIFAREIKQGVPTGGEYYFADFRYPIEEWSHVEKDSKQKLNRDKIKISDKELGKKISSIAPSSKKWDWEPGYKEITVYFNDPKSEKANKQWDNLIKELKPLGIKDVMIAKNSKGDLTMSVLNELESFVKGVIRNANDEDEKEIKNEKVDKRELIEEVGGMLKGKVDDEIIRTIIKKMEEASYDESEAGSADNKKVKNESEEEKEDKKAENKKVKNEESEDDKEKAEELKKEDKEDVDNKCNNSKTDFFDKMNKIYNSTLTPSKSETEYTSRADRLKAGEEYFKV